MVSVEEFIVDNFGWVLAVLAILIITIIGFIADKKSKEKKEGKKMNEKLNNQLANSPDVMPLDMQQPQMVPNQNMNQVNEVTPAMPAPQEASVVMPEIPSPSMEAPVTNEFEYKPLSEQKPSIPPRFEGMPVNPNQAVENNFGPTSQMSMPAPEVNPINNFGQTPTMGSVSMPQPEPQFNQPTPINDFGMNSNVNTQMPQTGSFNSFNTPVMPFEQQASVQPMQQPIQPQPMDMNMQQVQPAIDPMPQFNQPVMPQPTITPIQPEPIPLTDSMVQPQPMPSSNMNVSPLNQPYQAPMYNSGVDVNNMYVSNQQPMMDNFNNNNTSWQ